MKSDRVALPRQGACGTDEIYLGQIVLKIAPVLKVGEHRHGKAGYRQLASAS